MEKPENLQKKSYPVSNCYVSLTVDGRVSPQMVESKIFEDDHIIPKMVHLFLIFQYYLQNEYNNYVYLRW